MSCEGVQSMSSQRLVGKPMMIDVFMCWLVPECNLCGVHDQLPADLPTRRPADQPTDGPRRTLAARGQANKITGPIRASGKTKAGPSKGSGKSIRAQLKLSMWPSSPCPGCQGAGIAVPRLEAALSYQAATLGVAVLSGATKGVPKSRPCSYPAGAKLRKHHVGVAHAAICPQTQD